MVKNTNLFIREYCKIEAKRFKTLFCKKLSLVIIPLVLGTIAVTIPMVNLIIKKGPL